LRFAYRLLNYKRARRANIYDTEALQLFGKKSGSKGSVTADVDSSEKNHEWHEPFLACGVADRASRLHPFHKSAAAVSDDSRIGHLKAALRLFGVYSGLQM
jgi:hypothetical protein